jgi:hypothetical protein
MGITADRIGRALDREIEILEQSDMTPEERAREIADLEREARWEYAEERARRDADDNW